MPTEPPTPAAVPSAKRQRCHEWTQALLAHMECRPVADTDLFVARIKGQRRFAVTDNSQPAAECALANLVYQWAYQELVAGRELPKLPKNLPVVDPAVYGVVRISRLKGVLRLWAADWGSTVKAITEQELAETLAAIETVLRIRAAQLCRQPSPLASTNTTNTTDTTTAP